MGGAGSGRRRKEGSTPAVPRVSHGERAVQRRRIAEHAVIHGVQLTTTEFAVSHGTVYAALRRHKLQAAKEVRVKSSVTTVHILKRMLIDGATAEAAAASLNITLKYAQQVRREAAAVGFIFQEKLCDTGESVSTDAEPPDGRERSESPAER